MQLVCTANGKLVSIHQTQTALRGDTTHLKIYPHLPQVRVLRIKIIQSCKVNSPFLKAPNYNQAYFMLGRQLNGKEHMRGFGAAVPAIFMLPCTNVGQARIDSIFIVLRHSVFRDDLEGLGYILMYFCGGSLPWQGLRATGKKDKYEKIMEKKMATTPDLLCRDYPPQFCEYLRYCRNMEFTQEPDYAALRRLFKDLLRQKGFHYDFMFDWTQQTTQRSLTSGTSAGRYSSQLPPPGREGQFVAGQALDVPGPTQQDEAGPNQPSNVRNPSAAAPTAGGPPSSMNRPVGHTAPPRGKYAGEEPRSAGVRQQHVIPTQNSRDVSSVQVYIRDEVPRSGEGRQAMLPSSAMIPHPALRNVDAPRRASRGYEESRSPQGRRERYYDPEAPESYNRRKGNRIEEVEFEDGKPHDGHDQDDL
eukprot:GHVT01045038.1.p1 GENE.GHVT01045038.1~~GHVT01045038.1.p1  ORF type:complete len:417 (-),score=41.02 GHVT01045038.1:483-1733(-)